MTYLVYNFSSIICQLCDFGDIFPLLFLFLGGGILMKLLEIIIKLCHSDNFHEYNYYGT